MTLPHGEQQFSPLQNPIC